MTVRFTEFLKYNEKDIHFYFVQENSDLNVLSFEVHAKIDESFTFRMLRNGENIWTIIPQNVPEWIQKIKPLLSHVLQQRLLRFFN